MSSSIVVPDPNILGNNPNAIGYALNAVAQAAQNDINGMGAGVSLTNTAPVDADSTAASAGSASQASRQDHKHHIAMQTVAPVSLTSGTKTVNTGVTITANSQVIPILRAPAGTLGYQYKITSLVVGAPGTGAFTVTAVDTSGATVTTDTSSLAFAIIG